MNLKIQKFDIKIDYSFLLFSIILLYISEYKLIFVISLSLLVHELFHLICYSIIKRRRNEEFKALLTISIFGGLAYLEYQNFSKIEKILLFISGIIGNIILVILLFKDVDFRTYNLILIIFNLIPVYPLDGYNIYKQLKCYNIKSYIKVLIVIILIFIIIFLFTKSFCILIISIFITLKNINIREEEFKNKLFNINQMMKKTNYNIESLSKI